MCLMKESQTLRQLVHRKTYVIAYDRNQTYVGQNKDTSPVGWFIVGPSRR